MSIYGIYLFYIGIPHMTNIPDSRRVTFLIACVIAGVVLSLVIAGLVMTSVLGIFGMSAMGIS